MGYRGRRRRMRIKRRYMKDVESNMSEKCSIPKGKTEMRVAKSWLQMVEKCDRVNQL
jgi:hypothetical protein